MSKYYTCIIILLLTGNAYSHDNASAPKLGDTLNKTITIPDEEKIGRNIYKNLQRNNFIINDFFTNTSIIIIIKISEVQYSIIIYFF